MIKKTGTRQNGRFISTLLGSTAVGLFLATSAIGQTQPATQNQQMQTGQSQQSLAQELKSLTQVRQQLESQPAGQKQSSAMNQAEQILGNIERDLTANAGQAASQESNKKVQASIDDAQKLLKQPSTDPKQVASALQRVEQDLRAARPNLAAMQTDTDQASAERTQVQVSQPASDVQVRQPAPQIAVQQPAPDVTVQQPQPKITVNQPPAQVTVEQPKPKVIVEQADPKVNVTQAEPKVTVNQPKPDVKVQQAQPDVQVQQAQPDVKVQQQGQAQVTIREESQVSQQQDRDTASDRTAMNQPAGQTAAPGASSTDTTAAINPTNAVSDMGRTIVGRTIYGSAGEEVGDIEDVTMGTGDKVNSALVDVGGFLGIGGKRVAIDVSTLQLQGDRLVTNLTEEQVRALPKYNQ